MVSRFGEPVSQVVSRESVGESVTQLTRKKDSETRGETVSQVRIVESNAEQLSQNICLTTVRESRDTQYIWRWVCTHCPCNTPHTVLFILEDKIVFRIFIMKISKQSLSQSQL